MERCFSIALFGCSAADRRCFRLGICPERLLCRSIALFGLSACGGGFRLRICPERLLCRSIALFGLSACGGGFRLRICPERYRVDRSRCSAVRLRIGVAFGWGFSGTLAVWIDCVVRLFGCGSALLPAGDYSVRLPCRSIALFGLSACGGGFRLRICPERLLCGSIALFGLSACGGVASSWGLFGTLAVQIDRVVRLWGSRHPSRAEQRGHCRGNAVHARTPPLNPLLGGNLAGQSLVPFFGC